MRGTGHPTALLIRISGGFHQSFIKALSFLVHPFTQAFVEFLTVVNRNTQDHSAATRSLPWCKPMSRNNTTSSTLPSSAVAKRIPSSAKTPRRLKKHLDLLRPVRQWLDDIEIRDRQLARFLSKAIPAQCPFERDIKLFGHLVAHIPPLCKLNPLYEQLVGLRFRALCYLVDQCGEDIQVTA